MPNVDADNVTYLLRPAADPPYELYGPDPNVIAVGWDVGRATFFAHVSREYPEIDGNSYRSQAVHVGTAPYEVNTARNILNLVRPWAIVPPEQERALEAAAGPHEARQATVWATNKHPGHGLAGWLIDLDDPTHGDHFVDGPFDIAPQPDATDWTVRTTQANVYGAASPGAVIRQRGGFTRDDALLTAARLAASGKVHNVAAFLGDDDLHPPQLTEWRHDWAWQVGWRAQGLASTQQDLSAAIDRAIARAVDSAPEHLAAQAERRWQQPGGANVEALAETGWRHGYEPAYRDAHVDARSVLNTAADIALRSNPRAAATLRCLWIKPDSPDRHAPPISDNAVIAAASDLEPPWRSACDAVWHVSRATARRDATRDAAVNFLNTWRVRGGESATADAAINRRPAADLIPDLIQAVCKAPRTCANWIGGQNFDAALAEERLATDLLASVSAAPDVAGEHPARRAGPHPAALAGAFHRRPPHPAQRTPRTRRPAPVDGRGRRIAIHRPAGTGPGADDRRVKEEPMPTKWFTSLTEHRTSRSRVRQVAPSWGWRIPGAGRVSHLAPGMEYQGTTVQLCGLYPYVAGSGSPVLGVPIGRHMLWGEVLCLDPLEWLRSGLVTNPGMFLLGQPGVGKSSLAKRLITGLTGYGTQALVLGDTKPDYTRLVEHLGGQVIRVGRGLDRINPLDAGPLGTALARMSGPEAGRLRL